MITAIPTNTSNIESSQFHQIYYRLQTFVNGIDNKLMNKIQSIQHNFADQYKYAVKVMNDQLQQIRIRLDATALKQKANEKMKVLEEQRNLFRQMSRDLDMKFKQEIKINKQLKSQIKDLNDELENYKKICFKLQLQMNKSRKQMVQFYKSKSNLDKLGKSNKQVLLQKASEQSLNRKSQLNKSTSRKLFAQTISHTTLPVKRNILSNLDKSDKLRYLSPSLSPTSHPSPQIFQYEQIFTSCLNNIKKQLLYRTASTFTNNYQNFIEQGNQIPFQKLTATDKKQLIRSFMEDPKVLDKFYEFVFKKQKNDQKFRSTTVRLFDNNYNQKNLLLMKRKFQQRVASSKLSTIRDK